MISWVIEGSNDESSWVSLDTRNTEDLCGDYIVKNYSCSNTSGFHRYIRIRQTGLTKAGNNYLQLSEIEFFGTLDKQ